MKNSAEAIPLRILILSTNGLLPDGITAWMLGTLDAMDKEGMEFTTVSWNGGPEDVFESAKSIGLQVASVPDRKTDPKGYMAAYKDLLVEGCFDIVHVSCNSALAAFELHEAKKHNVGMRIAHSHNTTSSHRIMDKLLRPAFYHYATDYFACGVDAGRWLFGDKPFSVIPNGKGLASWGFDGLQRECVRSEIGLTKDDIAIGHVGRFNEQKNHMRLLNIFAELKKRSDKYRLVLIGDGGLLEKVKAEAKRLKIEGAVSFLGRRNDVPRLLSAMDCMVLPSLFEGFPNVVLEWQLSGLPIVMSTNVTDDVVITPLVTQVPLRADHATWADVIELSLARRNRVSDSENARKSGKELGYDILDCAIQLRRLYLEGANR